MTNKDYVIYGLLDPETNELRYIGYTNNPKRRFWHHYCPAVLRAKTYKNCWLRSLVKKGLKAQMIILQEYQSAEELPEAEIDYIKQYKSMGARLTNGTDGGDGATGFVMPEKARQKISLALRGKKKSEQARRAMSIAQKKIKRNIKPPDCTGRKMSEDTKRKISEALKKRGHKPPVSMGRKCSEETRKKLSEAAKKGAARRKVASTPGSKPFTISQPLTCDTESTASNRHPND